MRTFDDIYAIASGRKGSDDALEALLEKPLSAKKLAVIPDDRWLSMMTKCIFNAGFNWKVVDAMWPGFEEAFEGFQPGRVAMFNEDDFDRLVQDERIVRHGQKIRSVQENAVFVSELAREYGSAGAAFGNWPSEEFEALLDLMKSRGSRLGGNTGQYFLRFMNRDGFILSEDVVARLLAEGIVDKAPTSRAAMRTVQKAFNSWREESGRSLKEISRVLALSI